MADKQQCACGSSISSNQMSAHLKSRNHATRMEASIAQESYPGEAIERAEAQADAAEPLAGDETVLDRVADGKQADEDDYEGALEREGKAIDEADLDAVDITERPRGSARSAERERETITDELIRSGEHGRIVDAPPPFAEENYGRESLQNAVQERIEHSGAGVILDDRLATSDPSKALGRYVPAQDLEPEKGGELRHTGFNKPDRHPGSLPSDERPNMYDLAIGDTKKIRDKVFDWAIDPRGFRHTFTYFWFDQRILLDVCDNTTVGEQRAVEDKAQCIEAYNRAHLEEPIGYAAVTVGTPLHVDDLLELKRGAVLVGVRQRQLSGPRIPAGQIVDVGATPV